MLWLGLSIVACFLAGHPNCDVRTDVIQPMEELVGEVAQVGHNVSSVIRQRIVSTLQHDQPLERFPWEVEEKLHPVTLYQLDVNRTYVCGLCTHAGDIFVLYGSPRRPEVVSFGSCEYPWELVEMTEQPETNVIALGYYLRPSECYTRKLLQLFHFNNKVPVNFTRIYGPGRLILDAIEEDRKRWQEKGVAVVIGKDGLPQQLQRGVPIRVAQLG